jgi:hypothetical protein
VNPPISAAVSAEQPAVQVQERFDVAPCPPPPTSGS